MQSNVYEQKMSCTTCTIYKSGGTATADTFDWVNDLPDTTGQYDIVEVKFKATRKEFFRNEEKLNLKRGDKVVVATSPGHDIGEVTLTGYLADKQFRRKIHKPDRYSVGVIYRKATPHDLESMTKAKAREQELLIQSRKIANRLGLEMKIGDVEVRADNGKAIFYYIADGRVDFRQLIKEYAHDFRLRIEMKQIGARQEAGRVGGIGSCGRELCCSSWRTEFTSVSIESLGYQGLSQSAQKMAGQCGKLKCCLMYELDAYVEAGREFPEELLVLETAQGLAKPIKTDYLAGKIWYSVHTQGVERTFQLTVEEVRNHIQDNKKGIRFETGNVRTSPKPGDEFVSGNSDIKYQKPASKNRRRNKAGNRGTASPEANATANTPASHRPKQRPKKRQDN